MQLDSNPEPLSLYTNTQPFGNRWIRILLPSWKKNYSQNKGIRWTPVEESIKMILKWFCLNFRPKQESGFVLLYITIPKRKLLLSKGLTKLTCQYDNVVLIGDFSFTVTNKNFGLFMNKFNLKRLTSTKLKWTPGSITWPIYRIFEHNVNFPSKSKTDICIHFLMPVIRHNFRKA